MKRCKKPFLPLRTSRVLLTVMGIVLVLGYYGRVRAQSGATDPIKVPLRPLAPLSSVPIPTVFGLEGILADQTAAIQLGKALFWDMQAGSEDEQACATCHFNAGADSRATNQVNPGQAGGDNTFQIGVPMGGYSGPNYHYKPGTADAGFGGYHDGDFPFHKLADPNDRYSAATDHNDVSGSQGVAQSQFVSVVVASAPVPPNPITGGETGDIIGEGNQGGIGDDAGPIRGTGGDIDRGGGNSAGNPLGHPGPPLPNVQGGQTTVSLSSVENITSVPDPVFSYPDPANPSGVINTRRTTGRNTPSNVNAVFNYRNFWDGRAQNTCNGVNPFGSRDNGSHLLVTDSVDGKLGPAMVAMKNSSLCSQALGPILNGTEMSPGGRSFHDVGRKLLSRTPLARQLVDPTDSSLGAFSNSPKPGINISYMAMIQKAFLPEWWQAKDAICVAADGSPTGSVSANSACPAGTQPYSQMEYNFSLFWGVAIQAYESTLVADQTPMDKYLEGQQSYSLIGDGDANSYTIQLAPGVTRFTISVVGLNPLLDFSDQDVYGFDNGYGRFIGTGIDGTIDYNTGTLVLNFEDPPVPSVPVRINYSVGATPMTEGQLRGLEIFQTKGRCVVCHGGPELSNASVDTVTAVPLERMVMGDMNIRVYDTGYYHIGVRPGAEDGGLAGADPVATLPLSQAEFMRKKICDDPTLSVMIPGRPGDGITQSPLSCGDDIARTGFFKTPQLRNIALTAPYFHNGSQLTLEQVVEFYNRGADFNIVSELNIMDPDIEPLGLGLTLQEKQDLVDFLRVGLTDPRTVAQSAPFDHPQLFTPNGHSPDGNGYPVQNDPKNPGQAITQYTEVPPTGAAGGQPIPTFLDNLLGNAAATASLSTLSTKPITQKGAVPVRQPASAPPAGFSAPAGRVMQKMHVATNSSLKRRQ